MKNGVAARQSTRELVVLTSAIRIVPYPSQHEQTPHKSQAIKTFNHASYSFSMLQKSQRTLHHNILQYGSRWDVDSAAFRSNNDHRTLKSDSSTEVDGARDRQVVELDDLRDAGDALLEVGDLLEVISKLNEGSWTKTIGVNLELAVLQ